MSAGTSDSAGNLDLPADLAALAENARRYAQPKVVATVGSRSVIVFRIGGEWLALPTGLFREIGPLRPVHAVPHRRDTVLVGLVNVRGILVPCVSLARALGLAGADAKPARPRLAVLADPAGSLAFVADEIDAVLRFDDADLQPVPTTLAHAPAVYTRGVLRWKQTTVGVLDAHRLAAHLNALLR